MKSSELCHFLDEMIPSPRCELNYKHDYELVIAVMLSAQCTDKRVNIVTEKLFNNRSLENLSKLSIKVIEKEIRSLGSYTKKAQYIKGISERLLRDYNGKVPNNREYLESLPGIGRKSCNVILSELFDVPTIAVDTHVERVTKRIGIAKKNDSVLKIEQKLTKFFDEKDYNRVNHQLVLFGRYICKAVKPDCEKCLIKCKNAK